MAMNGQYEEAMPCYYKSMDALKERPDFDSSFLTVPRSYLGLTLWACGRFNEAEAICMEALESREDKDTQDPRVGRICYALGNIKNGTGDFDGGFTYYKQAVAHYQATLEARDHRIADTCVKLANYYVRLQSPEPAMKLLDEASQIYQDQIYHLPEQARVEFKRGRLLQEIENNVAGAESLRKAHELLRKAKGDDEKEPLGELKGEDFDEAVVIWSR